MRFRPRITDAAWRSAVLSAQLTNQRCTCAGYTWGSHHKPENGHHPACPKVNAHNLRPIRSGATVLVPIRTHEYANDLSARARVRKAR